MKIQLIAHASVIISTHDCAILTDPWFQGTAFNDSWALNPPAAADDIDFTHIQYLWISHEHPDHFHIQTLKSLPMAFKESVQILYQENNSNKVIDALKGFGYKRFEVLPNRKKTVLAGNTSVYCYQVGTMDSALAVLDGKHSVLNINDSEFNRSDCEIVKRDIGTPDLLLNQFSIAGYSGQKDRDVRLPKLAQQILKNCSDNQRDLGAKNTIPFASFVYFCQQDNYYINRYHNAPSDFCRHMEREGLEYVLLYPGQTYQVGTYHNNAAAEKLFQDLDEAMPVKDAARKSIEDIRSAFQLRYEQLQADYWHIFRSLLAPVTVAITDLGMKIEFSLADGRWREINTDQECDLDINSQPLWFMFKFPFGLQTLGVSARYTLNRNERNWKKHRILMSLNSAEIYLSWKLLRLSNAKWMVQRFSGIMNQLSYQLRRM